MKGAFNPKKYAWFSINENFYLVIQKRRFYCQIIKENPGRLCNVIGNMSRFIANRGPDGQFLYKYSIEAKKVTPFSPPTNCPPSKSFNPKAYSQVKPQDLSANDNSMSNRLCFLKVNFESLAKISPSRNILLGSSTSKWEVIHHQEKQGLPLIFLAPKSILNRAELLCCKKGAEIFIYGRVFYFTENYQSKPAILAHAVGITKLTMQSDLLRDNPRLDDHSAIYASIDKPLLLPITLKGIYDGDIPKYRQTGRYLEFPLVFRGSKPVPESMSKKIPASVLAKNKFALLHTQDNGFIKEAPIILVPLNLFTEESEIEEGDTLFLRCKVNKFKSSQRYFLLVKAITLPPIQIK